MRFRNYGSAKKARRAMRGYGDATDGCSAGYSADANGNCTDFTGAAEGCSGNAADANGNCLQVSSAGVISAQGCPGNADANGNCVDSSGNIIPATTAAPASTSTGLTSVLTGVGTALTSIFKPASAAKPATSSGSSILLPALFALGAVGVVVVLVKSKKKAA